MSFLFKAKLSYEDLVNEAKNYKVPLKFYTYGLGLSHDVHAYTGWKLRHHVHVLL